MGGGTQEVRLTTKTVALRRFGVDIFPANDFIQRVAKPSAGITGWAMTPGKETKMRQVEIAKVCHEVNRAYCQALGDNSQPPWEDAPQWQRDSAEMGVKLHTENRQAGPEASHESWMAQKLADGWKYGQVKNPEAKEHPCIVPFSELPVEQQAKDYIFRAVVHALIRQPNDALYE